MYAVCHQVPDNVTKEEIEIRHMNWKGKDQLSLNANNMCAYFKGQQTFTPKGQIVNDFCWVLLPF